MNQQGEPNHSKPPFDASLAVEMVGKYVLVGLTYVDPQQNVLEQKQVHGTIIRADETKGFAVKLRGPDEGETFWLPPDLRSFQDAKPGEYRLRSTGEVVVNPDLLSTWTIDRD